MHKGSSREKEKTHCPENCSSLLYTLITRLLSLGQPGRSTNKSIHCRKHRAHDCLSMSQGSPHRCPSAVTPVIHANTTADTVLLLREDPRSTTTPRPAPWSLRAGRTYSQCHTLQSRRWGRTDSRFSSSRTAARGGLTAGPGTCSGSAAPGGHRSG